MPDNKPCPYCGHKPWPWDLVPSYMFIRGKRWQVKCTKCKATGPEAKTIELARADWNVRAGVA